jgi:hypothetical protein
MKIRHSPIDKIGDFSHLIYANQEASIKRNKERERERERERENRKELHFL